MAVTYGFYNSVNKDRAYNAIQMSQIFDGIINDGIYMSVLDHFAVTASGGMNISVGGGRAWFNHTWTYNDSSMLITIDESEFEANRIDAVVLKVDRRDSARKNDIVVIKGTPADVPEKPVIEDGNDIYYHPLAYITINAAVTVITDADIENAIGVDPRTPFVTGIIEHIHAEDLVPQWQAEWTQWNNEKRQAYLDWVAQQESDMETWISNTENDMDEWQGNHKQQYDTWAAEQEANMTQFLSDEKQEVRDWYQHLRDELDEHQAVHLQNQIDVLYEDMDEYKEETSAELNEETFKLYHDLCNKNTHIDYSESGDIAQITSNSSDYSAVSVITFEDTETGKIVTTTVTKDTNRYIQTVVINNETHDITESYIKEVIS